MLFAQKNQMLHKIVWKSSVAARNLLRYDASLLEGINEEIDFYFIDRIPFGGTARGPVQHGNSSVSEGAAKLACWRLNNKQPLSLLAGKTNIHLD